MKLGKATGLALVAGILVSAATQADIVTGLQAHYSCEGTAQDVSGQGRHLIGSGGFAPTPFDLDGRNGRTCRFQGAQRLELSGVAPDFSSSAAVSYAFWIRRVPLSLTDDESFMQSTALADATTNSFLLTNLSAGQYFPGPDPGHCCGPRLNVFAANPNFPFTARSTDSNGIADGNWHLVVVTSTGTVDSTLIYVDGAPVSAATVGTAGTFAIDLKPDLFLGARSDHTVSSPGNFEGDLDDVRIYARVLSAGDVAELAAPPGISGFPNVTLTEDEAPGLLAFSVSDLQTPAASLLVNFTNDNPGIVNLALGGSGPSRFLSYTNVANANGTANVQVSVSDGGPPVVQNFTFTLTPVNDPPSFTAGSNITVPEDAGPQFFGGWATAIADGDPEVAQGLNFVVTLDSGTVGFAVPPSIDASGNLTFTTAPESSGSASLSVYLQDSGGGMNQSPVQNFTITVPAVNDAPLFTAGPNISINEDLGPQTFPNWATAIDDGEPVAVQNLNFVTQVISSSIAFDSQPAVDPSGQLSFTLLPDANGSATVEVYLQDDGGTANGGTDQSPVQVFTITVQPINDAPDFDLLFLETAAEDSPPRTVPNYATAITRGGGADEAGQTLSFIVTPSDPTLFAVQPAIDASGTLTYTLAPDRSGPLTLSVRLMDSGGTANGGQNLSPLRMISVNLFALNDPPVFTKGPDVVISEDAGAQTLATWATGIDEGGGPDEDAQNVSFLVTGNSDPGLFLVPPSISPTGELSFTAAADRSGVASISLRLDDDGGAPGNQSAVQSFNIQVNPVNDAPDFQLLFLESAAEDDPPRTVPNYATAITRGGGADEAGQTLSFIVTPSDPTLFSVQPAIDAGGTLTYTLAPDRVGPLTLSVQLMDNGGTANGGQNLSPIRMIAISLLGFNDPPVFAAGPDLNIDEDAGPQSLPGWATAIGPGGGPDEAGQTLNFVVTGNSNPALFATAPTLTPTGQLSYAVIPGASGTATIGLRLDDNGGAPSNQSAVQNFAITVNPVNDPPAFVGGGPDQVLLASNTSPQTVPGFASGMNDGDPDFVQALSFVLSSDNPALFSVPPQIDAVSGALTYTLSGQVGVAVVSAVLRDDASAGGAALDSAPDVFTITAQGAPRLTIEQRDPASTVVGEPFNVRVRVCNPVPPAIAACNPAAVTRPGGTVQVQVLPQGNVVNCTLVPTAQGGTAEALCSGAVAPVAAGKLVRATYLGDGVFTATAQNDIHIVNRAASQLTILADTPDPSGTNEEVTVSFQLAAMAPSQSPVTALSGGTMTISDGLTQFSAPFNPADPSIRFRPQGSGTITLTLTYDGNANFEGSSASVPHTLTGVPGSDLAVSIDNGRPYLDSGQAASYQLVVRNLGGLASTAQLDAPVPEGLTGYQWTCTATPSSSCQSPVGAGGIVAGVGLAPGGSVTYAITAQVTAAEGQQVRNRVQITPSATPPDNNPANDVAEDVDAVGLYANGFEGN